MNALIYLLSTLCISSSHAILNNKNVFRQIAFRKHIYIDNNRKCLKYMVDIDGTICTKTNSDYENTKPISNNIEVFNNLYDKGNEVHYWTARGAISGKNWDELTLKQLKSWGVKFNSINMGKPHYDVWIDDKAYNAKKFCE
jgi:hypothetical protein